MNILESKCVYDNKIEYIFDDDAPTLEEKLMQLFDYYINASMEKI